VSNNFSVYRISLVTLLVTLLLIGLGGYVRQSGAGLACPDWPGCYGQFAPPTQVEGTLIEMSHRWVASVVGFLTLALAIRAFQAKRVAPLTWRLAFVAGLTVVTQVILGAIVIAVELKPQIVTTHLFLAFVFSGLLVSIIHTEACRTGLLAPPPSPNNPHSPSWLMAGALLTLVVSLLGAFIGSAGAALGCASWPLCNTSLFPTGDWKAWLGFTHRLLALALVVLLASNTWRLRSNPPRRTILKFAHWAAALGFMQIGIGALNPILLVPTAVAVAHLVAGACIWLLMVAAYLDARHKPSLT